jgi:hypothetical protein
MDRHDQISPAPWNLVFSVDLVRCTLVLGIIGRGPVPAANVSLCFSLAMVRPLRQARQARHKTFVLRGTQHRRAVARRNAENQRQTLYLTIALLEGGRGTELDTSRAEAQWQSTLASIPPLETAIKAAMYRLGVLISQPPTVLEPELSAPSHSPRCRRASRSAGPTTFGARTVSIRGGRLSDGPRRGTHPVRSARSSRAERNPDRHNPRGRV